MEHNKNDDIEIIYWGEDEEQDIVNAEAFKKKRRFLPDNFDWKKEVKIWIKLLIIAVFAAIIINKFVIINATVPTGSMEKTIHAPGRMVGFRWSYTFSEPKRGDIIIFEYPDNTTEKYVKRIVGMPGETIEIRNGVVYIDNLRLEEDYVYFENGVADIKGDFERTVIPEDCYFVLGDNRNNSKDSRYWKTTHFVERDKILGKAIFTYWPSIKWLA